MKMDFVDDEAGAAAAAAARRAKRRQRQKAQAGNKQEVKEGWAWGHFRLAEALLFSVSASNEIKLLKSLTQLLYHIGSYRRCSVD